MNPWDKLSNIFGDYTIGNDVPEGIADNILIAWPCILAFVNQYFGRLDRLEVLDFGCGGGHFCRRMHELGSNVTGYDTSQELVRIAQKNLPRDIVITDSDKILSEGKSYDLITSIMVFQFIPDVEKIIPRLLNLLKAEGCLIYAVFNPEFVKSLFKIAKIFYCLKENTEITATMKLEEGSEIPVYARSAEYYRLIFAKYGCKEIFRDYPVFTEKFLKRYPMPFSTEKPEFLIQAFKK